MFCEYEYDEGTKKGRDSGKDEHGIYSGKINQYPAKEGTDHTAKSIVMVKYACPLMASSGSMTAFT